LREAFFAPKSIAASEAVKPARAPAQARAAKPMRRSRPLMMLLIHDSRFNKNFQLGRGSDESAFPK
jgi:hypothetical protein